MITFPSNNAAAAFAVYYYALTTAINNADLKPLTITSPTTAADKTNSVHLLHI